MMIGNFYKEGASFKGRIFSRERCGRVITFRPMSVEQGDGPDFVVQSETEAGDYETKIGVAWKRTTRQAVPIGKAGSAYVLEWGAMRINPAARWQFWPSVETHEAKGGRRRRSRCVTRSYIW